MLDEGGVAVGDEPEEEEGGEEGDCEEGREAVGRKVVGWVGGGWAGGIADQCWDVLRAVLDGRW